ncbi:cell division protein FtsQ/DivIB, partial [Cumulibacter manganitolerans]|uniref:cell division protein FtsQ/DivIB n=1 Tax=Cumulibacter manganitolerans TaxID=1884992 RepID=UPI001295E1AA
ASAAGRGARPTRGGRPGRIGGGRSPLNPGFPRWAVYTAVALVVAVLASWALFSSSFFGVRDVQVTGASVISVAKVREAVGLGPDDSLVSVSTSSVRKRVEQLPPVARASVSRSWPGTLVVRVTERTPIATVPVDGEPWLLDADGVPYARASRIGDDAAKLLPLEVEHASAGDHATREAAHVIAGLDAKTRALVGKVTAKSAAQVTLVLTDGREVIWGDASRMNDKLTMLPAVLEHSGSVYDISSPTAIVIK